MDDFDGMFGEPVEIVPDKPVHERGIGEEYTDADLSDINYDEIQSVGAMDFLISLPSVHYWFPFFLFGADKTQRRAQPFGRCTEKDWTAFVAPLYEGALFDKKMLAYDFQLLVKAGVRLGTCALFVFGDGSCASALLGRCKLVLDNESGTWKWEVDRDRLFPYIVKITPEQAVSHQIWCAALKIATVNKRVQDPLTGVQRVVGASSLVALNSVPGAELSKHIKRLITPLLAFPKDKEGRTVVSEAALAKAQLWLTKVSTTVKDTPLPAWSMSVSLAYFTVFRKNVPYTLGAISIKDIFTKPYLREVKDCMNGVLKNSIWIDGTCVPGYCILARGVEFLENKRLGGELPVDVCDYLVTPGVTIERDGGRTGAPGLKNKIDAVRSIGAFDGAWYSPSGASSKELRKATALIVPYDSNGAGLGFVANWISAAKHKKAQSYALQLTYGAYPCLWIEAVPDDAEHAQRFTMGIIEAVWKTLPVMAFFNFNVSLARAKRDTILDAGAKVRFVEACEAKGIALQFCWRAIYTGKFIEGEIMKGTRVEKYKLPFFKPEYLEETFIPGRHVIQSALSDAANAAASVWNTYDEWSEKAATFEADFGPGDEPAPKKARRAAPAPDADEGRRDLDGDEIIDD